MYRIYVGLQINLLMLSFHLPVIYPCQVLSTGIIQCGITVVVYFS
eukprot:UN14815